MSHLLVALLAVAPVIAPTTALAFDRVVTPDNPPIGEPPPGFRDDPNRPIVVEPRGPVRVATTTRTNIVVLLLDDVPDLAPMLLDRMPVLGRLFAQQGLEFRNALVDTPLCCPSRAGLLTGLSTAHHGVIDNDGRMFDPRMTIATQMRASGYTTLYVGKYLNLTALLPDKQPPGWTHSSIGPGGYFDYTVWVDEKRHFHDTDANDYSTDVHANQAVAWLRTVPPDRPVFTIIAPFAAHATPNQEGFPVPAPRHVGDARCAGIDGFRPPNYNEPDVSDKPSFVANRRPLPWDGYPLTRLCESMLAVDELVGRVQAELIVEGRAENTLFVLTSDNGMGFGQHRIRNKGVPYAVDVPLYVRWPAVLGTTPGVIDEPVLNIDLAPTFCAVGGCTLGPYPTGQAGPDGLSLLPLLLARGGQLPRDELFLLHPLDWYEGGRIPGWYAVRTLRRETGRWLYVAWKDGQRELYELDLDPWMLENLAGLPAFDSVEQGLTGRIEASLGGPVPTPEPSPDRPARPSQSAVPSPKPSAASAGRPSTRPRPSPSPSG